MSWFSEATDWASDRLGIGGDSGGLGDIFSFLIPGNLGMGGFGGLDFAKGFFSGGGDGDGGVEMPGMPQYPGPNATEKEIQKYQLELLKRATQTGGAYDEARLLQMGYRLVPLEDSEAYSAWNDKMSALQSQYDTLSKKYEGTKMSKSLGPNPYFQQMKSLESQIASLQKQKPEATGGGYVLEEIPDEELPKNVLQEKKIRQAEADRYYKALTGQLNISPATESAIVKNLRSADIEKARAGDTASSVTKREQARFGAEALREQVRRGELTSGGALYQADIQAKDALMRAYMQDAQMGKLNIANAYNPYLSRLSGERQAQYSGALDYNNLMAQIAMQNAANAAGKNAMYADMGSSLASAAIMAAVMA